MSEIYKIILNHVIEPKQNWVFATMRNVYLKVSFDRSW